MVVLVCWLAVWGPHTHTNWKLSSLSSLSNSLYSFLQPYGRDPKQPIPSQIEWTKTSIAILVSLWNTTIPLVGRGTIENPENPKAPPSVQWTRGDRRGFTSFWSSKRYLRFFLSALGWFWLNLNVGKPRKSKVGTIHQLLNVWFSVNSRTIGSLRTFPRCSECIVEKIWTSRDLVSKLHRCGRTFELAPERSHWF